MKSFFLYPKLLPEGLLTPLILLAFFGILVGFLDTIALAMIVPLSEMIVSTDIDYSTIPILSDSREYAEKYNIPFNITSIIIAIIFFQIVRILSLFFQGWLGAKYSAKYEHTSRINMLNSYSYMPWENYVKEDSGDVFFNISRVTSIASTTYGIYCRMISVTLTISIYLITAIYATWQLSLIALMYSFIAAFALIFLLKYAKKLGAKRLQHDELIFKMINQLSNGMKYIRISGLIDRQRNIITTQSKKLAKANESIGINESLFKTLSEALFFIALVGLLGVSTMISVLSAGGILLFSLLFFRIFQQVRTLQYSFQTFLQIEPYVENMNEIHKKNKKYIDELINTKSTKNISILKSIEVKNLSYSYLEGKDVLKDVNISIKAKKHTAIVGLSGVGKTTLLDLIIGLILPTSGSIKYDEKLFNKNQLKDLRKSISYVPQGGVLFSGTILENITFGSENYIPEQLDKSLEMSNVNSFIQDLPHGIDTNVGEGGFALSGGQRQRVILARAIYRDPNIIILDEATSELDSISQHEFIESVNKISKDTTIVTVAHRLSNIVHADNIYVMKNGSVVESGNFKNLVEINGEFSKMYKVEIGDKY